MILKARLPLVLIILVYACTFPKFKNPNEASVAFPEYSVVFNEIDNFATLTINGEQIFRNETIIRAADKPIVVDIKESLQVGDNTIQITLFDDPASQCLSNEWHINFDIYSKGELFEYWQQRNEPGDQCEEGIKVDKTFTLALANL
ncbi:MAG: hypothetical protein AAGA85_20380 [Bacteroidota bacterium]